MRTSSSNAHNAEDGPSHNAMPPGSHGSVDVSPTAWNWRDNTMKVIHCAPKSRNPSITNAEKRVPKSAVGTGADEEAIISVCGWLKHRTPVDGFFKNLRVGLTQEGSWHCVDNGSTFGVVVWVGDFFEEFLAKFDELGVGLVEVTKDGECAPDIVHGRRPTKRRCSLECYGHTTSDDVVGMFILGQLKLVFERPCELDRKTLIRALRTQQVTFGLAIGEDIARPIGIPHPIAARRRRIVLRCDRLGWNILRLTHQVTLAGC